MTEGSVSKTVVLTGHGGYDKVEVREYPRPSPQKGEVLVNIKANGINFAELLARQGLYPSCPKLPAVLGLEGAGDVLEVGEDVTDLKVGDRIMCVKMFGLWTEFATVSQESCFTIPSDMSYEEAAAIPVNYVTAYHMLFELGNLRKGSSVLIHMAAGGVGIGATQLCKTVPDVTVFGTASASKHDAIRANGVDYPIDYRNKDYVEEIRKISPSGVNMVLDPLSGPDSVKGFDLLKPFGKIIHFGGANVVTGPKRSLWTALKTYMSTKSYSPLSLMTSNKCVAGYHLGKLGHHPELIKSAALELMQLYKDGKIKPKIDSVWAYEDIAKGMARMHDRLNIGKVIISPQKKPEEA